ncbi:MAG: TonB-dependent receptor [Candidatus Sphingomonas phytovorans]|nr:TonB-dependent receptor [Sphingomonas sp.]WEK00227.1 MAG: TonB-dependent receptor [Sphingomonas sp.]
MTAQKRAEWLRDTPVAVTALRPMTLIERNQVRLQDYFAEVPGLSLISQGEGSDIIVIRGIATGTFSNPTTAVSIDDVPVGSSTALVGGQLHRPDLDPFDLERIEVLRGPQGTLYGASSLGGLVKYITTDPSVARLAGRLQVDTGIVEHGGISHGFRGAINVPLASDLALRASGFSRRTAGFVDNLTSDRSDVNAITAAGGRLSLLWAPSDQFSVKLGALHQRTRGYGGTFVTTDDRQVPIRGDLDQLELPGSGAFRNSTTLLTANVGLRLGWADLSSVTGYWRNTYSSDVDQSALLSNYAPNTMLGNRMKTAKMSQELRLSSPVGETFGWLVGGFYTHERSLTVQSIDAVQAVTAKPIKTFIIADFPTTYEEVAVFGDATVHFSPRFSVQAGLRYSRNHQDYAETDTGPLGETSPGVPYFTSSRSADRSVTFLITPQYRLGEHSQIYARFASGYRPGGPNGVSNLSQLPKSFGADRTSNYELGLKGESADGAFGYEASAYSIDWRSIQLRVVDTTSQFSYFVNVGNAFSRGAEIALSYRTRRRLQLSMTGSYNVAEFSDDPPDTVFARKGDSLPFSPRWSGSVSIDRDIPLDSNWTGFIGGSLSYVGQRLSGLPTNPQNPRATLRPYATADLRLGARSRGWAINLFARNLTDRRGALSITPKSALTSASSVYKTVVIPPRTIGLSAVRSF